MNTSEVIYTKYRLFIFLLVLGSVHRWLLFTFWVDNFLQVAADDMIKLSIEGPQVQYHGPELPIGRLISLMHQGPVIHYMGFLRGLGYSIPPFREVLGNGRLESFHFGLDCIHPLQHLFLDCHTKVIPILNLGDQMLDPCDHQNAFFFESPDFWLNQGKKGQEFLIPREKAALRDFFLLLLICFHLIILGWGIWYGNVQWTLKRGQVSHVEGVLLHRAHCQGLPGGLVPSS